MPLKYLVSWIGRQDLDGCKRQPASGPIVDFLRVHPGATAVLLSDWPKDEAAAHLIALRRAVKAEIQVRHAKLRDSTDRAAKLLGLASRQALAHRIRALGMTG